MTNSTGAECKSYSCEEHSGTRDKFVCYIHNVTRGSKQMEREGRQDSLCAYLFPEMLKIKSEK